MSFYVTSKDSTTDPFGVFSYFTVTKERGIKPTFCLYFYVPAFNRQFVKLLVDAQLPSEVFWFIGPRNKLLTEKIDLLFVSVSRKGKCISVGSQDTTVILKERLIGDAPEQKWPA